MQLFIEKNIEFVIDNLYSNGFEAFLVGGCVRDMLMGTTPNDYDIATNALPEQIEKIFERTVLTGAKHGTVTVIVDKTPIEVTTYRTEGEYTDFRRPDSVEFVSDIKFDLSRRDFTINAMAYNQKCGLIDLFYGKEDLEKGIIKAVGDPEKRFHEDALRILRLYRFSSVLNFKIDEETEKAAILFSNLLKNVSSERILTEITKAVCGANTAALKPLIETKNLEFLKIADSKNLEKISLLPKLAEIRLFAFLYLSSTDINETLTLLKASNSQKKYCCGLEKISKKELPRTKPEIKSFLRLFGVKEFLDFLTFKETIFCEDCGDIKNMVFEILENKEPYLISDLCLNGNDIKNLGFSGEEIKIKLEEMIIEVSNNPNLNSKENLTKLILNKR